MKMRKRHPEFVDPPCLRGLGRRLRAARRSASLTQSQVAGERYTKSYISAIEQGLVRPSLTALAYVADRLGTTCALLLTPSEWSGEPGDDVRQEFAPKGKSVGRGSRHLRP